MSVLRWFAALVFLVVVYVSAVAVWNANSMREGVQEVTVRNPEILPWYWGRGTTISGGSVYRCLADIQAAFIPLEDRETEQKEALANRDTGYQVYRDETGTWWFPAEDAARYGGLTRYGEGDELYYSYKARTSFWWQCPDGTLLRMSPGEIERVRKQLTYEKEHAERIQRLNKKAQEVAKD